MKTKLNVAILLLGIAATANAIQGQWTGRYWYANTGKPLGENYSDGNCFLSNGTWYSTTIPGLRGHWYQKGDELYINAVHPQSATVFSSQLETVSSSLLTGQHQHWAIDGSTSTLLYLKETLTYQGAACRPAK